MQDDFFNDPTQQTKQRDEKAGKEKKETVRSGKQTKILKGIGASLLALVFVSVGFVGGWFGRFYSFDSELRSFLWAYTVADKHYYRPLGETDFFEKLYSALELDPYSQYFSPDGYSQYVSEGEGQNIGVGISLTDEATSEGELPRLFLLVENSPACRAGLRKGMYVLGYGKEKATETGNSEAVVDYVSKQTDGFVLRCGYAADGSDARDYSLKREAYQAAYAHYRDSKGSVRVSYEGAASEEINLVEGDEALSFLDDKTGYLRLDEFSGNAAEEVARLLTVMKERGRVNLILDLRTNGGGYLDICTKIAARFLRNAKKGSSPIAVRAVYRSGREDVYRARRVDFSAFSEDSRILVLADENTASASECLIGALVDYGTVSFGDIYLRENAQGVAKTYGKGIMQSTYTALDGSAMKLTVAEIYWPLSNRSIHGVGVTPADGAKAVSADLIWGESDPMLEEAARALSSTNFLCAKENS